MDSKGNAIFPIIGGISGVGAISKYGFAVFNTEPMFVTKEGVFAVTTADITGEKYAEARSFYVNPKLVRENLAEAVGIEYKHYYYLAIDGRCYVADSRQKVYESNAPLSSYQYEWYYFENVPARIWFEYGDHLYFGTEDGKIYRFFHADEHSAIHNVYQDDGVAIKAIWDTPYFSFDKLGYLKRLVGFWVMLAPYYRSGVNIYYRSAGERRKVRSATADIFSFDDVDFERFSFNVDDSPLVVATNMPLRRFMLIQFRLENDAAEGFGFYGFEAQYVVQGRYRSM